MNWSTVFQFPESCQINTPITKISLKSQEHITLSESKLLDGSAIRSMHIFAVMSKAISNIEAYVSDTFSFLEVYFIQVTILDEDYHKLYKASSRLLHKLIPHHCIIITQNETQDLHHISLYKKVINKNDNRFRVLNDELISSEINRDTDEKFIQSLAFNKANKLNLQVFYNYYIQTIGNLNLVDLTKEYKIRTYEVTTELLQLQEQVAAYEFEIVALQKELNSVTQMNEKVALNTDIHVLKQKIQKIKTQLG